MEALVWDYEYPAQDKSNRPFYSKVLPTKASASAMLDLKGVKPGAYRVRLYRTGFKANDAYTAYLELGSPKSLSAEQVKQLDLLAADKPELAELTVRKSGTASFRIPMHINDVVLAIIEPR